MPKRHILTPSSKTGRQRKIPIRESRPSSPYDTAIYLASQGALSHERIAKAWGITVEEVKAATERGRKMGETAQGVRDKFAGLLSR